MTESSVVHTSAGPVRGTWENGVRIWRGIPYAAPPIGDLRWRAPQPEAPWTEPRDAVEFGAIAPQPPNPIMHHGVGAVQDEDCLSLNVWSPAGPDTGLPVMVWVHGGAYLLGSSRQPLYDAAGLAARGDVVVVSINYRVGALGWLDLRQVAPELGADANCGLLDVIAALEWVRDNVSAFGGDPGRVTLAGESAGGGIVTSLLAAPRAAGLFHRAIAQSSPVTSVHSPDLALQVAQEFLAELGDVDLRTVSVLQLLKAGSSIYNRIPTDLPGRIAFAPTVDGVLLTEPPSRVLHQGRGLPVPLLIGTNKDESSAFRFMKSPLMPITPEAVRRMFDDIGTGDDGPVTPSMADVVSAYREAQSTSLGLDLARDIGFRMPTVWAAEGHRAVAPVHLYRFDWSTPFFRAIKLGATHGTELPYLFGNFNHTDRDPTFLLGGRRTGARVSDRLQARWLAFVNGGDPNSADVDLDWPAYTDDRQTLLIDGTDQVVPDPDAALRRTWGEKILAFD